MCVAVSDRGERSNGSGAAPSIIEVLHRAVRRRHCAGGGARVNFGRRRRRPAGSKKSAAAAARRGVGCQKHFVLRFTKKFCKFCSILKIFLRTFLFVKTFRFSDDQ